VHLTFWRCVIVGFPDNERHTDGKPQNYAPATHRQFPIPNSQFPIPNSQFPIPFSSPLSFHESNRLTIVSDRSFIENLCKQTLTLLINRLLLISSHQILFVRKVSASPDSIINRVSASLRAANCMAARSINDYFLQVSSATR
jgi:hypothetical protein